MSSRQNFARQNFGVANRFENKENRDFFFLCSDFENETYNFVNDRHFRTYIMAEAI